MWGGNQHNNTTMAFTALSNCVNYKLCETRKSGSKMNRDIIALSRHGVETLYIQLYQNLHFSTNTNMK